MSVVIGELNKVSISGAASGEWSGNVGVNNFKRSCGAWKVRSCKNRSSVIFVHGTRLTKFRNVGENVGGGTIDSERDCGAQSFCSKVTEAVVPTTLVKCIF